MWFDSLYYSCLQHHSEKNPAIYEYYNKCTMVLM